MPKSRKYSQKLLDVQVEDGQATQNTVHEPTLEEFISTNFEAKECYLFVATGDKCIHHSNCLQCHCGGCQNDHENLQDNSLQSVENHLPDSNHFVQSEWSESAFRKSNSNAFGKIIFNLNGSDATLPRQCDYLRLSDDSDVSAVLELFKNKKYWNLLPSKTKGPNFVISILGSSRVYDLPNVDQTELLHRSLAKAIKSGRGWVITTGYYLGISRDVGATVQSVQELQTFPTKSRVTCIGIAPWGRIKHRHMLDGRPKDESTVQYTFDPLTKPGCPIALDPNHTHFLLVDDGYRNYRFSAAEFRARLEKKITESTESGGLGIPVVNLLIQGSDVSLRSAALGLKQNVPLVICAETGYAADLILFAMNEYEQPSRRDKLKQKIKNKLQAWYKDTRFDEVHVNKLVEDVLECCACNFEASKTGNQLIFPCAKHDELDMVLFDCLLATASKLDLRALLSLAQDWKRLDIAEKKLLESDTIWQPKDFYDLLRTALVKKQIDQIKFCQQHGVNLKEFLTVARLETLYKEALYESPRAYLKMELEKIGPEEAIHSPRLRDIHAVVVERAAMFRQPEYDRKHTEDEHSSRKKSRFNHPGNELFLWAILMNRKVTAKYFWDQCEHPLIAALGGSLIAYKFSKRAKAAHSEKYVKFANLKKELESYATGLVEQAFQLNPDKATALVQQQSDRWSGLNALQVGAAAFDETFMSTPCCNYVVSNQWKGNSMLSGWQIVLYTLTILPIVSMTWPVKGDNNNSSSHKNLLESWFETWPALVRKIYWFYSVPAVKFTTNVVSYILFLALYAYVILFGLHWHFTLAEIALHVWFLALFFEHISFLFAYHGQTNYEILRDWWSKASYAFWNRLFTLTLIAWLISLLLRCFQETFVWARLLLCLNYASCMFRFFKVYLVNSYLGPKVVMMKKMTMDLIMFILVFAVLMMSFSISSHALQHPRKVFYPDILPELINSGLWEIFGEVRSLDAMETSEEICRNSSSTDYEFECKAIVWPVPILLACYLFFSNILLVNMLIATFACVFNKVQENAEEIWRYQMYLLLEEYKDKSILVSPLSIFSSIFTIVTRALCGQKQGNPKDRDSHESELLSTFERLARSEYLHREKRVDEAANATQESLTRIENKLNDLQAKLELLLQDRDPNANADNLANPIDSMLVRQFSTTIHKINSFVAPED